MGKSVGILKGGTVKGTLLSMLPHMSFTSSGVGAKPTIRFTGVNVQIVSGSGATNGKVNGEELESAAPLGQRGGLSVVAVKGKVEFRNIRLKELP